MRRFMMFALAALLLAACGGQSAAPAPTGVPTTAASEPTSAPVGEATAAPSEAAASGQGATLTVMTHDSFNVSEDVVKAFEDANAVKLMFRKSGDAGSTLNQAILSKETPLADLLFGVDNSFLSRALEADIFEPYDSPQLANIPAEYQLDSSKRLLPVDYGFVSINYDKAFLQDNNLTPPQDLRELTKAEWKGKLVVENAATSSPGLAFLMATIAQFGEQGSYTWKDYWRDLRANDLLVSDGWEDAYYTQFSGSSGKGPRPLVVSYGTSPAAEVFFSDGKLTEPPTANLEAGSFRQVEFVGILKGTKQRALAEKFVDWMLSKQFQDDIPLQMFVYPASKEATQPEVFIKFAQPPAQPTELTPDTINANRERWIQEWTEIVLR